jgi:hypothetical protein
VLVTALLLTLAAFVGAGLLLAYRVTLLAWLVSGALSVLLALGRVLPSSFVVWAAIGLTKMLTREILVESGRDPGER